MVDKVLEQISNEIQEYRNANEALDVISWAEVNVNEYFANELKLIEAIKESMALRLDNMLSEYGIDKTSKEYESLQKDIRKRLYTPVKMVVETGHEAVSGKTLKQETYQVTLVESKPKLVKRESLSETEYHQAHQLDVQSFIDAGLHTLLSISTDDMAVGYVQARAQSGNPLQSVALVQEGYCKVKLL